MLAKINWIFFDKKEKYDEGLAELCTEIKKTVDIVNTTASTLEPVSSSEEIRPSSGVRVRVYSMETLNIFKHYCVHQVLLIEYKYYILSYLCALPSSGHLLQHIAVESFCSD